MPSPKPKIIVILGPTASGKSSLGIALAREFNGEIVSADSRQVYKGMNIGTGKVPISPVLPNKISAKSSIPAKAGIYSDGIPHHLLDIVEPTADFSLAHYQAAAFVAIDNIIARGQTPFLVGGTALYIYSVIDNYNLSNVGANLGRRKELEKLSINELQSILIPSSVRRGKGVVPALNASDIQNPRRLIRAIEKLEAGITLADNKKPPRYDALILGINAPREELYKKIDQRVDDRINQGMIEEVIKLRQTVPDEKLLSFGLEYRFITEYLMGKYQASARQPLAGQKEIMIEHLKNAIHAFARRQMTWWKRDQRIVWVKSPAAAQAAIKKFL